MVSRVQKLMLDLARDDLIPGRLEAFMDSAVQYTKNNMFKQLALMVIARWVHVAARGQPLHNMHQWRCCVILLFYMFSLQSSHKSTQHHSA